MIIVWHGCQMQDHCGSCGPYYQKAQQDTLGYPIQIFTVACGNLGKGPTKFESSETSRGQTGIPRVVAYFVLGCPAHLQPFSQRL
jgi:hypothetical protein